MIPQYHPVYGNEVRQAIVDIANSDSWFTEHVKTKEFEDELKKVLGAGYCSVVTSGTMALSIALVAIGVKPGDAVLVPDLTMIATANAVRFIGAEPIFCDIDKKNFCMDINSALEMCKQEKIKAVIYVPLNGRCDENISQFKKNLNNVGIVLICDNAQALGCFEPPIGDIDTYSFSPHKIISTGQGGAIATNNVELGKTIKRLKDFGRLEGGADVHDYFGTNSKITDIQSVMGLAQLKKLDSNMYIKRTIHKEYYSRLAGMNKGIFMFPSSDGYTPWFVDIYCHNRDELMNHLKEQEIQTRKMYPPIHSQKCYETKGEFPNSINVSKTGLWLPSSLDLTVKEIDSICHSIEEF